MIITNNQPNNINTNNSLVTFGKNMFALKSSSKIFGGAREVFGRSNPISHYEKQHYINRLFRFDALKRNNVITPEFLNKNYSSEGMKLMETFLRDYCLRKDVKSLSQNQSEMLLDIYNSTTKENSDVRTGILKMFKRPKLEQYPQVGIIQNEITQMSKLFERVDKDKQTKSFIEKSVESHIPFESIAEINEIIDKFGAKKLDIFFDNFTEVMTKTEPAERLSALEKGLTDPFYESVSMRENKRTLKRYRTPDNEGLVSKAYKTVQNFYNKLKFKFSKD